MKTELFSIRTSRVHRISGKVLSSSLNGVYSGKDKTMAALHPPNPEAVFTQCFIGMRPVGGIDRYRHRNSRCFVTRSAEQDALFQFVHTDNAFNDSRCSQGMAEIGLQTM